MKEEGGMRCRKCHEVMVEVKIFKAEREYTGKVCTGCGRILSRDGIFKTKG